MRNLALTGITAFLFGQQAQAQVPIISASQYVITVQSTQNADYDYLHNAWYSRQYSFYDAMSTITANMYGGGTGGFYQQTYVTELKKPVRVMATHKVNYDYWYCESYNDPNCQNPYDVRQANKKKETPKQPAGQGSNSRMDQYPPCENCWWNSTWFYTLYNDIPLRYPSFDTTINQYGSTVTISVRQASDQNYNLPSNDNISIKAQGNVSGFTWEYQVLDAGWTNWVNVPTNLIQPGGAELILNGQSLFGSGSYWNYINKTVVFRLRNTTSGTTSNILIYTHRLSSPKIVSVTTVQNPCFGFNQAYINVKLDRQLYTNETLNIFLKDTTLGLDYSALNLDNTKIAPGTLTYTWLPELVQGGYKVSLIGKYFDYATYTGSPNHFNFAQIQDPELVRLYLAQNPVLCNGGNSGKITVAGKGGVGNFKYELVHADSAFTGAWTNFTSAVPNPVSGTMDQPHNGLIANTYKVRLRDGNNCMNRDSAGNEIYKVIQVTQPAQPLHVSLLNISPITAHNTTNGAIKVRLSGGTLFPYSVEVPNYRKYQFEWRDSTTNALISNFTLDTTGKFEINIANLPEGTYTLKAWDASYGQAPAYNQQGCIIIMHIPMKKPLPLNVNVVVNNPIKCGGDTTGQLLAVATGGIPITPDSTIYNFTWYKLSPTGFSLLNVPNDSVLRSVNAGTYRVVITDKYNNDKSILFVLNEPTALDGIVNTTTATCYFTPNATMTAVPSGGTAPYSYEWSTGDLTAMVDSVAGGQYVVVIKDANLCQVTKQVNVTSPQKITANTVITPVTCHGSSSGAIALTPTGGGGGYTYLWSTGSTASAITGRPAGTYWYRVTDVNGCFDTDTLTLGVPEPYTVTVGADRKICTGQTVRLFATPGNTSIPLTYSWSGPTGTLNGQTVNVTAAGTYIVTAANTTGCQKKDTIVLQAVNAVINTGFTVSTQVFAGEKTTLVNISASQQDSALWLLPSAGFTVLGQSKAYCDLNFADTGHYTVGIKAFYSNGCIDEKYKDLNVVRKEAFVNTTQTDAFLKQFSIYPNPTSGSFTLSLVFNTATTARVRVINILTNTTISDKMLVGAPSYTEPYNVTVQPAGTYVVVIETPKGNYVHKLNKL